MSKVVIPFANPIENQKQNDESHKELIKEALKISEEQVKKILARDKADHEMGIAPDKTGCYRCFVRSFITFEMSIYFTVVAQSFLENNSINLSKYSEPWFYLDEAQKTCPSDALNIRLLNIIFNSAKSGDRYAKELIIYLYKRFYKKEYNQIKRFREINSDELFSIVEDNEGDFVTIAGRILTMAEFLGIELHPQDYYVYYLIDGFNTKKEEKLDERLKFLELKPSLFASSSETIDSWNSEYGLKNTDKLTENFFEIDRFIENCFQYHGYPADYAFLCNDEFESFDNLYTRTLALLKTTWRKKEFSFEDVQMYSVFLFLVETIISISDSFDIATSEVLGVNNEYLSGDQLNEIQELKKKINIADDGKKQEVEKRAETTDTIEKKETKEDYYLSEIASLRNRLHEQEQKYNQIREQYSEAKRTISEQEGIILKYESDRDELIALRKYVNSIREDSDINEVSLQEMQADVKRKKIVIIGGHNSWINKLKAQYPEWIYISLDNYRTMELNILDKADRIYFFTDYISHSIYGGFVKIARDKKIPFGYLHKLNIEEVTKYIYYDINAE